MKKPFSKHTALAALKQFAAAQTGSPFLSEDFVTWVELSHTPPSDRRLYGGVFRSASADGVVARVGYALARTSNNSPKCLWRAA